MKIIKENKYYLWLILILLIASFLRLYKLGSLLPLFGDEVDTGYNAYSILKTGRDVTGHFLPIYLKTLIDTKASLLAYLAIIPIYFFGLNAWSIRIIPALSGILSSYFIFLIILRLSKNKIAALFGAFLMAVVPWAIHFSRGAFEANLMLFCLLLGIWSYLKIKENKNYVFLSLITFALSLYAYHAAKILTPLIILGLLIFFKNYLVGLTRKKLWLGISLFLLMIIPIIYASLFAGGQQRFSEVSFINNEKVVDQIIIKRLDDNHGSLVGPIFHNKGEAYFNKFTSNYLESFSPQFLFLNGDLNFRHSSGAGGELYLFYLPFLLIGLFVFIKERKRSQNFLVYLLLIAPLPGAITIDSQHAIRLLFLLPVIVIISAFGLAHFLVWLSRFKKDWRIFIVYLFLIVFFIFNFTAYLHQYFYHYPKESWRYWAYGYQEAMQGINQLEKNYDQVLINNTYEPSILWFLFWNKYSPQSFQRNYHGGQYQENILPGFDGFKLDKFYFGKVNDEWVKKGGVDKVLSENKKTLFLITQMNEVGGDWDWRQTSPTGVKVLKTITNPYGQIIFYLVTHE